MKTDGCAGDCYEFRVKGHVGESTSQAFDSLAVRYEERDTLLSGRIIDQAALHGVLMKIRDLGLVLISVDRVETLQINNLQEGVENGSPT